MYGQITLNLEGEKSKSFPIKHAETYIGRDKVCEVRLDHPDIALRHCLIIVSEGGFPATVHNLSEIKPALLNGRLIFPSDSQLKNGDIITIGPRKLEWSYNKRCLPSTWSDVKGAACSVKRTRSSEPVHKQRLVAIVSPHRNDERDLPPKKRRKTMFSNIPSSSSSTSSSSLSASTSSTNSTNHHHHRSPHHHHLQEFNYSSALDFSRRNIDTTSRPNDSAVRNSQLNRSNCSHNSSGINNQTITSRIPLRLGQNRGRSVTGSSQGTLRPPKVTCGVPLSSRTSGVPSSSRTNGVPSSSRTSGVPSSSRTNGVPSSSRTNGVPSSSRTSGVPSSSRKSGVPSSSRTNGVPSSSRTNRPVQNQLIPSTSRLLPTASSQRDDGRPDTSANSSIPRARILKIRTPHKISIINDIAISVQPIDLQSIKKEPEEEESIPDLYVDQARNGSSSGASTSESRHVQPSTSNESTHSSKLPSHNVKKGKCKRSEPGNSPSQSNTSTSSLNESKKIPYLYVVEARNGSSSAASTSESGHVKPSTSNESTHSRKLPSHSVKKGKCKRCEPGNSPSKSNTSTSSSNKSKKIQKMVTDSRKIPFYIMRRKRGRIPLDSELYSDSEEEPNLSNESPNSKKSACTDTEQGTSIKSETKTSNESKKITYFYVDKARNESSSAASTSESGHAESGHVKPSTSNESTHSRKLPSHSVKKGKCKRSEPENSPSQSNTPTSSSNESKKIQKIVTDTWKIPFYIMRRKRASTPLVSELYSDSEEEPNLSNESPNSKKTACTDTEQGISIKSEAETSTENREHLPNVSGSSSNETNNIQRIESDTRKIPFYYVESFSDDSSEEDVGTMKNNNTETPNKSPNVGTSLNTESPETYHTPQNGIKRKTNSSTDKSKKKSSITAKRVCSTVKKPHLRLKSSKTSNSLRIQQGDSSSQSSYISTKSPDSSVSLIKSVNNMSSSIMPATPNHSHHNNATENTNSTQMPVTPPNDGKYQILMRSSKRESFRRKIFNRSLAENSFTLQNNSVSPVERNSVKFDASAMVNSSPRSTTPPNICSPKIVMRSSKKESLKKLTSEKSKNPNTTPLSPKLSLEFSANIFKKLEDKSSEFENLLDSPLTGSKLSVISFNSSKTTGSSRGSQPKLSENLPSTSTEKIEVQACSSKPVNNSVDDKFSEKREIPLKTYANKKTLSKSVNNSVDDNFSEKREIPLKTYANKKTLSKSVEIPSTSINNIHRDCKSFNGKLDRIESDQRKSRTNSKEKLSHISNRNMDRSLNDSVEKCLKGESSKGNINSVSNVSKKNSSFIDSNVSSSDGAHISPYPVYPSSSNKSALNATRVSFMESNSTSWQMKTSRKSTFKSPKSHKNKRTQANKMITSTPRTNVGRTPVSIVWDLLAEVDSNTPSDSVNSSPQEKNRSHRRSVNESDVSTANASMLCDTSKTNVKKLQWDNEVSSKVGNSSRNIAHCSKRIDVHSDFTSVTSSASYNLSERSRNQEDQEGNYSRNNAHCSKRIDVHSDFTSTTSSASYNRSQRSRNLIEAPKETSHQTKKSASFCTVHSPNKDLSPPGPIKTYPGRSYSSSALNSHEKDKSLRHSKESASLSLMNSLNEEQNPLSRSGSSAALNSQEIDETPRSRRSYSLSALNSPVINETPRSKRSDSLAPANSLVKVETPGQSNNSASFSSVNPLKMEKTTRSKKSNCLSSAKSHIEGDVDTPPHTMDNITIPSVESQRKSKTPQLRRSMKSSAEVETPRPPRKSISISSVNLLKEEITPIRSLRSNDSSTVKNSPKLENTPVSKQTPHPSVSSKKKSETQQFQKSQIETPTTSQNSASSPRKIIKKSSSDPTISLQVKNTRKILSKSTVELSKNKKETPFRLSRNKSISQISVVKNVPNKKNAEDKTDEKKVSMVSTRSSSSKKADNQRMSIKLTGKSKISKTPAKLKTPTSAKAGSLSNKKIRPNQSAEKSPPKKSNINSKFHRNCLSAVKTVCKPKVPRTRTLSHPSGALKIASNSKKPVKISVTKNVQNKTRRSLPEVQTAKKNKAQDTRRTLKLPTITPKIVVKKPVKSPRVSSKITTPKSKILTPISSKKCVITPKNTVKLNPVAHSSRRSTKNSLKTTPTSTPKSAFPTARKALTTIRKPLKLGGAILKRKLDALCLEKSRAAAKKLKAEPAKSLDKKKVAALLMCHKKKSPIKESNSESSALGSINSEKEPMKTPNKSTTTPKIKKLCFTGVNETTPSNTAIINRMKTPAKNRTPNEDDNTTVDSLPENDLKQEESFQEDDIFSALYLSRKTSTPAQEVEKPLRRLRSSVNKMKISNSSDSTINSNSQKHVFFATPIADFADVKQSAQAECSLSTAPSVSCLKRTIDPLVSKDFLDESDGKESLKVVSTPTDDYGNVSCVKNIMHLSPQPDYSNVSCLKRNLELSPQPDYTDVVGVKSLLELKPIPDYSNVSCMKRVFTTSPVANYTDVTGVKQIFTVPPTADYVNTRGLKELRPANEYLNISGVRELFKEPPQIAAEVNEEKVETVTAASDEAGPSTSSGPRKLRKRKPNKETEAPRSRQMKTVQKETGSTAEKLPAEENENKHTPSVVDNNCKAEPSTRTWLNHVTRNLRRGRSGNRVTTDEVINSVVPSTSGKGKQAETGAKKEEYDASTKQEPEATVDENSTENSKDSRKRTNSDQKIIDSYNQAERAAVASESVKQSRRNTRSQLSRESKVNVEKSTGKASRKRKNPEEEIIELNNQAESAVASESEKSTRRNTRSQLSKESKVNVEKSTGKASRKRTTPEQQVIELNNQAERAVASESAKPTRRNTRSQLSKESKVNVEKSTGKASRKRTTPEQEIIELNNLAERNVASESVKPTQRNTRSQLSNESKVFVEKPTQETSRKRAKRQEEKVDLNNQSEPEVVSKKSKVNKQTVTAEATNTRTTRSKVVAKAMPKRGKRSSITLTDKSRVRLVSPQKEVVDLNNQTNTRRTTRSKVVAKAKPKRGKRSSITLTDKSRVRLLSSQKEVVDLNNQAEPAVASGFEIPTRKNSRSKVFKKSNVNKETKTTAQETTASRTTLSKVAAKAEPKTKRRSSANKSGFKLVSSLKGNRTAHTKKKNVHFDRSYSKPSTNKNARKK